MYTSPDSLDHYSNNNDEDKEESVYPKVKQDSTVKKMRQRKKNRNRRTILNSICQNCLRSICIQPTTVETKFDDMDTSQNHQLTMNFDPRDDLQESKYRLHWQEVCSRNISYRNSATNTSSDTTPTYPSSNYLFFPLELMIAHPFSSNLTENTNYYCENDCTKNLCKTRKGPFIHLDTISKLRLKNFVQSICDDNRNSKLFKSTSSQNFEDASTSVARIKSKKLKKYKRRKSKSKKCCSCKKDSSVISFHLNLPKITKSMLFVNSTKNSCCCRKRKSRRGRNYGKNDQSIEVDSPNSASNVKHVSQDTSSGLNNETKAISLLLGNQKIVISFEGKSNLESNLDEEIPYRDERDAVTDEKSQRQSYPSSRTQIKSTNNETHRLNDTHKQIERNQQESRQETRDFDQSNKKCKCLEQWKKNLEKNLMKFIDDKLNIARKRSNLKVDNYTSTSNRKSDYIFNGLEDGKGSQSYFKRSQGPFRHYNKGVRSCGCRKKFENKLNICYPLHSKEYSVCKNLMISGNPNIPDRFSGFKQKPGSCSCKNCKHLSKERKTGYSSDGPPVEYVYLQETQDESNQEKICICGSDPTLMEHEDKCEFLRNMNSRNTSTADDEENDCSQYLSNQKHTNIFQRNAFSNEITTSTTEFSELGGEQAHKKESTIKRVMSTTQYSHPIYRTESDCVSFDTKSELASDSQTSGFLLVEGESCLCCNKGENEVENKIVRDDCDCPTPSSLENFEGNDREGKYNIDSKNEDVSSADLKEEFTTDPMKQWFESILESSKSCMNLEDSWNELFRQRCNRNSNTEINDCEKFSMTLLENAQDEKSCECDELEQLLSEIESYWQVNNSNSNVFEPQRTNINENGRIVNDCCVESIIDNLDTPVVWKTSLNRKTVEVFRKYLKSISKTKLLSKCNKSYYGLPSVTTGKVRDLRLNRKMRIKSMNERFKVTNDNYVESYYNYFYRSQLFRDASERCSVQQGAGEIKIGPSITLFNDKILDKLHEMDLQKFTRVTKLFLGDIPMHICFDVEPPYINQCKNYGKFERCNIQVRESKRKRLPFRSMVNKERMYSLYPYQSDGPKKMSYLTISSYLPEHQNHLSFVWKKDCISSCSPCSQNEIIFNTSTCNGLYEKKKYFSHLEIESPYHQSELFLAEGLINIHKEDSLEKKLFNRGEMPIENIVQRMAVSPGNPIRYFNKPSSRASVSDKHKILTKISDCCSKYHRCSSLYFNEFVRGSCSKLPGSSMTYFMKLEYPCCFLIYSSFNQNEGMQMKPNTFCGTRREVSKPESSNLKCKYREKKPCCSCRSQKVQILRGKKFISEGGGRNCGCNLRKKNISNSKMKVQKLSKIYQMRKIETCVYGEPKFEQKQNEKVSRCNKISNVKMPTTSLMRRQESDFRNNHHKTYSSVDSEDQALTGQKPFTYCKHYIEKKNHNKNRKNNKNRRKCGCTKPYETKNLLPPSADKPRKRTCQCLPITDAHQQPKIQHTISPLPNPQSESRKRCPCEDSTERERIFGVSKTKEHSCSGKQHCKHYAHGANLNLVESQQKTHFDEEEMRAHLNDAHKCHICRLVECFSDILNRNESLLSIEFSNVDELISILDDVKKRGSKMSTSIKCLREADGNICRPNCDEYLITCSSEIPDSHRPNTIGITITKPHHETGDNLMISKSACTNTFLSSYNEMNEEHQFNYDKDFGQIDEKLSCNEIQAQSDSGLFDSNARMYQCIEDDANESRSRRDVKCIFKRECAYTVSSMYEPVTFNEPETFQEYTENCDSKANDKGEVNYECKNECLDIMEHENFPSDDKISHDEGIATIEGEFCSTDNEKGAIECIFKRNKTCLSSDNIEMDTDSVDNIKIYDFEEEKENPAQEKSCYQASCVRLMEPLITPEKILASCVVKGNCIRQKLLQKICVPPEISQNEEIPPKRNTTVAKKTSNKAVKKEILIPKTPSKKTTSPKTSASKVPLKQTQSKQKSSKSPNKTSVKQKTTKQISPKPPAKVPLKQTNSKQVSPVRATKVPLKKTDSKQVSSVHPAKVPTKQIDSKQGSSKRPVKVALKPTDSKQNSSARPAKVPLKKIESNQNSSVHPAKEPLKQTDSKQNSSVHKNKVTLKQRESKQNSSVRPAKIPLKQTDSKQASSERPVNVIRKQTNSTQASSVRPAEKAMKQTNPKQSSFEIPVLKLNELDQNILSHALDAYLRKKGF